MAGQAKSFDGDVVGLHGAEDFWIISLADDSTTGVNSYLGNNLGFKIYPNPANNIFNVIITDEVNSLESNLKILDVSGKILFNLSTKNKQTQIDISKIENGIYFLEVINETDTFVKKIIVQH